MRCSHCDAWMTPELRACPQCSAPLHGHATGADLVEAHRRKIAATRQRWQAGDAKEPSGPRAGLRTPRARDVETTPEIVAELAAPLNLLRLHSGLSPFRRLAVRRKELGRPQELRLEARPAVAQAWAAPVSGGLEVGLEPPALVPSPAAFPDDEAVPVDLRLEIFESARPVVVRQLPTSAEPADLWHAVAGEEPVLAGCVTPNAPVLAALLAGLEGDVMAYRTADGRRLQRELEAVARVVNGLGLRYAPAAAAWGGSRGQRVANPEQVLASRRVCCLDLAILWASLLERLGMHPLILLLESESSAPGHACCGVWTADIRSRQPVVRDATVLERAVGSGDLLLFDPTLPYAGAGDAELSSALAAGRRCLTRRPVALDLAACRSRGLTPLPRRPR